jgi:hypothetical protein
MTNILRDIAIGSVIAAATALVLFNLVHPAKGQQNNIFEDQYVLCSFEGECFTFNQDDYLSKSQIEEFQLFFNNDMDTYSMEDLIQ